MKWFYNWKTSGKLISAFLIVSILLAFIGFFGMSQTSKVNDGVKALYDNNLVSIKELSNAKINYGQMRFNIIFMNTLATPDNKHLNDEAIKGLKQQVEDSIATYSKTPLTQKEKDELAKFDPAWQTFNQFLDQCVQLAYAGDLEGYKKLSVDFKKAADALDGVLSELIKINGGLAGQTKADTQSTFTNSRTITITVVVISLLISVALGFFISQIISRPLNRMVGLVGKVSRGDLREMIDIHTKDEIGHLASSINDMIANLRITVGAILNSAESVAAASQQISATTQEIASGSASQADSAQNMSELFGELSAAINSVARTAEQASELTNQTMSIAQEGGKVIATSIDGMNLVNSQMSRLEDDSNKIGEIIEVIDDIAEQTNLLALNAAIEAARAGDQGRGFAVVADEVRKLAERSGEATKQITSIIKGMQENTRQSVKAVGDGVISSKKTGESFEKIIAMVTDSDHKVAEIAAASEEQAAQSSEVMTSIQNISTATEEAAASSEETASTAQSLAGLAEELNRSVAIFKIK